MYSIAHVDLSPHDYQKNSEYTFIFKVPSGRTEGVNITGIRIQFQINDIKTEEFAIIEEAFAEKNKETHYSLETRLSIPQTEVIVCSIVFKFIQNNIPFLKVRASSSFEIEKESWESTIHKEDKSVILPTYFTDHLVVLTLGTLRGILHAKTEGTKFNRFFIPTINITELRDDEGNFSILLRIFPVKKPLNL